MSTTNEPLSPRLRAILDAGVRVIVRGGMRALTHRAVDAEAEIPEGSTSGYFRTRMALVVAISGRVGSLLEERVAVIGSRLVEGVDIELVGGEAVEVLVAWMGEPDLLLAQAELTTEAIRHREVADALAPYQRQAEQFVEQMMVHLGVDDPGTHALASLAAVQGVIAAALSQPPEGREAFVRRVAPLVLSGFGTLAPQG